MSHARVQALDVSSDIRDLGIGSQKDAEITDGVVAPVLEEDTSVNEYGALLIDEVNDNSNDRQAQRAVRCGNFHDVTQTEAVKLREIVCHNRPVTGGGPPVHIVHITGNGSSAGCFADAVHLD